MDEAVTTPEAEAPATPTTIADLQRKMQVSGTVKRTELYGAFIDLGVGVDAIIHISKLGKRAKRIADVLKVGETVSVWVDEVDADKKKIIVTMVEPLAVEWSDLQEGQVYTGRITRLEGFGAFVNIGAEKEGLVHVSELSHDYVKHPSEVVNVGDEIQVKVLGHSKKKRRINLSIKALLEAPEPEPTVADMKQAMAEEEDYGEMPTAMEIALKRAMGEPVDISRPRRQRRRKSSRRRREEQNALLERTLEISSD